MYFLYNLLLWPGFLLCLPYFIVKLMKGHFSEIKERLGFLPGNLRREVKGEAVIWVHAVSVGETVAASPICKQIRKQFPGAKVIFSTVTQTGQTMARKLIKADAFFYFPFDLPVIVKKVLTELNPELIIIMETELWPNFIRIASQKGCKVVLVNGRISKRSFRGYKLCTPLTRKILSGIDLFLMSSQEDTDHILSLGAEKKKVFCCGNTKYELRIEPGNVGAKSRLAQELQVKNAAPVLVAGSTHANEEELLIPPYKGLKAEFNDLVMILAPRHPERVKEIELLYEKAGISTVRRTALQRQKRHAPVILLDSIGELLHLYSLADLVFVGGSLVQAGGHNILEPAVYGRTIFVGPYMDDFKDILNLFLKNDACIQVRDNKELEEKMLFYIKNRHEAAKKGRNALKLVRANQGATEKITGLLVKLWDE